MLFDAAPRCGETQEMNEVGERDGGANAPLIYRFALHHGPLLSLPFLLPLDILPVFWLELVPDLVAGRIEL